MQDYGQGQCVQCGKCFAKRAHSHCYCSRRCSNVARAAKSRAVVYGEATCPACGVRFRMRSTNHRFCRLTCCNDRRSRDAAPRVDWMLAAYRDGTSLAEIGRQYGISKQRVAYLLQRAGAAVAS